LGGKRPLVQYLARWVYTREDSNLLCYDQNWSDIGRIAMKLL
jgi:hypothetical protein